MNSLRNSFKDSFINSSSDFFFKFSRDMYQKFFEVFLQKVHQNLFVNISFFHGFFQKFVSRLFHLQECFQKMHHEFIKEFLEDVFFHKFLNIFSTISTKGEPRNFLRYFPMIFLENSSLSRIFLGFPSIFL